MILVSAAVQSGWFDGLEGHRYALLATRRKSGSVVRTPVWFALAGNAVYVRTDARSGKTKRIRNNPRVAIAPCDLRGRPLGEAVDAVARILTEPESKQRSELLRRKYGLQGKLYALLHRERLAHSVIMEIRPLGQSGPRGAKPAITATYPGRVDPSEL